MGRLMVKTPRPTVNETAAINKSRNGMKRQGNSRCVRRSAGNLPGDAGNWGHNRPITAGWLFFLLRREGHGRFIIRRQLQEG